jgi:hypothetical protein
MNFLLVVPDVYIILIIPGAVATLAVAAAVCTGRNVISSTG